LGNLSKAFGHLCHLHPSSHDKILAFDEANLFPDFLFASFRVSKRHTLARMSVLVAQILKKKSVQASLPAGKDES